MEILILELYKNKDANGGERIGRELKKYGVSTTKTRLHSPDFSRKEMEGYDGIVLTGSDSMETYGKTAMETGIRSCILDQSDSGVSILGICGGNVILATSFKEEGYTRVKLKPPEIGWHEISLTDQGKESALFDGMNSGFLAFESHFLSVAAEDELSVLAKSDSCAQAFSYRPNVHGVQFHPEHTPETSLLHIKTKKEYKGMGLDELSRTFQMPSSYEGCRIFDNFINMINNRIN